MEMQTELPLTETTINEAVAKIKPFFAKDAGWSLGSLDRFAYRTLRDHYPAMSRHDAHIIVEAAKRLYGGSAI